MSTTESVSSFGSSSRADANFALGWYHTPHVISSLPTGSTHDYVAPLACHSIAATISKLVKDELPANIKSAADVAPMVQSCLAGV